MGTIGAYDSHDAVASWSQPPRFESQQTGDTVTTSGGTTNTTWTALRTGLRSLRRYPGLAVAFLLATLAQGALQGIMVWTLREVLVALSKPGGVVGSLWLVAPLVILTVWLLRSAGVYAAQVLAARLAFRVELECMGRVLANLLTFSVRLSDRTTRRDGGRPAYSDASRLRQPTFQHAPR